MRDLSLLSAEEEVSAFFWLDKNGYKTSLRAFPDEGTQIFHRENFRTSTT